MQDLYVFCVLNLGSQYRVLIFSGCARTSLWALRPCVTGLWIYMDYGRTAFVRRVCFHIPGTPSAPDCCGPPPHLHGSSVGNTRQEHLWCVCHKTSNGTLAFTIQGATPRPVRTTRPTLQSTKKEADPVWGLLRLSSWQTFHCQVMENLAQSLKSLSQLELWKPQLSSELPLKMCIVIVLVLLPPCSCWKARFLPGQTAKSQSSGVAIRAERNRENKLGEVRAVSGNLSWSRSLEYPSHCVLLDCLQASVSHSAKPQDIKEPLTKYSLSQKKQNDFAKRTFLPTHIT